jgi:hypothetical protein
VNLKIFEPEGSRRPHGGAPTASPSSSSNEDIDISAVDLQI